MQLLVAGFSCVGTSTTPGSVVVTSAWKLAVIDIRPLIRASATIGLIAVTAAAAWLATATFGLAVSHIVHLLSILISKCYLA